MEEIRKVYEILVGKPEGRRPLRRPRHRWEDNIKIYLRKIGFGGMDWIHLAQDRVGSFGHGDKPLDFIKRGEFIDY
jgi:hypothetical protein